MRHVSRQGLVLGCAWLLLLTTTLSAETPAAAREAMNIAKGEKLLFIETFDNNSAGWTNVASTPTTGQAMIGDDPAVKGVSAWMPSLADKQAVTSVVTLKEPVDLSAGPVMLYLRWRADEPAAHDASRTTLGLESSESRFNARMCVRPGASIDVQYRIEGGKGASKSVGHGHAIRFPDATTYLTYRLLITPTGKAGLTLQAFRYDDKEQAWTAVGDPATDAFTDTMTFDRVGLNTRNGVKGVVDAVAVTR